MATKYLRNMQSSQNQMSTEDFLRQHVFAEKKKRKRPSALLNGSMSTEDYLKYEVFGEDDTVVNYSSRPQNTPQQYGTASNSPQHLGNLNTSSMPPQTGPEDSRGAHRDFTPDSLPKHEAMPFMTREGKPFGYMELHRDQHGRIVLRKIAFNNYTEIQEFTYDKTGRLTTVKENGELVEKYTYGKHGERKTDLLGNSYTYDASLRLVGIENKNTGQVQRFHYDARGQLEAKETPMGMTQYAYNQHGELTDVHLPDGRHIQYLIDPMGRRASKSINGVLVEKYSWQDTVRFAGICDGSDNNHSFFTYPGRELTMQNWLPVGMMSHGQVYSLAFSQSGALLAVADSNGNVVSQTKHNSFGQELAFQGAPFTLPISFAGGLLDRDTGLIHFAYREYDPATGMFTQSDPLGYAAGDVHTYGWCLDDPVNLVDPLGLDIRVRSSDAGTKDGLSAGHVWISVDGGPFYGYYPKDGGQSTGDTGEWRDDTNRHYDKETYIATREGSGQDEVAKGTLKQSMENPGDYTFLGNNCVANVNAILKKAGIASPEKTTLKSPKFYHKQLRDELTKSESKRQEPKWFSREATSIL